MTLEDITNKQSYNMRWIPRVISSLANDGYHNLVIYKDSIKNNLELDKNYLDIINNKITNLDLTIDDINNWLLENDITKYKPNGVSVISTFTGKIVELGNRNEDSI